MRVWDKMIEVKKMKKCKLNVNNKNFCSEF